MNVLLINLQSILSPSRCYPFPLTLARTTKKSKPNGSCIGQNQVSYIDLPWSALTDQFFSCPVWSIANSLNSSCGFLPALSIDVITVISLELYWSLTELVLVTSQYQLLLHTLFPIIKNIGFQIWFRVEVSSHRRALSSDGSSIGLLKCNSLFSQLLSMPVLLALRWGVPTSITNVSYD